MATTPTRNSLLFFIAILLVLTFVDQTKSAPFLPVTKDPLTLQFTTVINQHTPLIPVKLTINLGAGLSWVNCDCEYGHCYESSSYRHVPCGSTLCKLARSNSCRISCLDPPGPNCNNSTCVQLAPSSSDPTPKRWLWTLLSSCPPTEGILPILCLFPEVLCLCAGNPRSSRGC